MFEWTEERNDQLRRSWDEGHTAQWIATDMGITRNAVLGKAHRLKLTSHKVTAKPKQLTQKSKRPEKYRVNHFQRVMDGETPPPIPTIKKTIASEQLVPFMALEAHHCRFPVGEGPTLFCGNDRVQGQSYCWQCCRIAYHKPVAVRIEKHKRLGQWV